MNDWALGTSLLLIHPFCWLILSPTSGVYSTSTHSPSCPRLLTPLHQLVPLSCIPGFSLPVGASLHSPARLCPCVKRTDPPPDITSSFPALGSPPALRPTMLLGRGSSSWPVQLCALSKVGHGLPLALTSAGNLLWVDLCPRRRSIEVSSYRPRGHDLIWKQGLYRGDQVQVRSLD